MSADIVTSNEGVAERVEAPAGALPLRAGWARRVVHRLLGRIERDAILVREGERTTRYGAANPEIEATLVIHDPRFYRRVLTGGSIAAGESYLSGDWSTDDLTGLLRVFARNMSVADDMEKGWARLALPFVKLYHALRRNTRRGSRKNIHAHYDLGNDFFSLFLDETRMYSCGIFERPDSTLYEASVAKNERIGRKLELGPSDHLLEIGTGWGGFAIHAARRYGCRVTTTTISREQYDSARERVEQEGLTDRVTLLLEDYRDLVGTYDKIVSIEMIEAVGHRYYPTFFETLMKRLKPEGVALVQAITIADQRYESARRAVDFIQRYIFPGSCIPSVGALVAAMTRASDLRLVHLEDQTPHYVRTLEAWRERFTASAAAVRELGFPDEFLRMWEYYFCYCEAGFAERNIGSAQLLFARPAHRGAPLLPDLN